MCFVKGKADRRNNRGKLYQHFGPFQFRVTLFGACQLFFQGLEFAFKLLDIFHSHLCHVFSLLFVVTRKGCRGTAMFSRMASANIAIITYPLYDRQ